MPLLTTPHYATSRVFSSIHGCCEKRHIKYSAKLVGCAPFKYVEVQILEQSHRGYNFSPTTGRYFSVDGLYLYSFEHPGYFTGNPMEFYAMGSYHDLDNHRFRIPIGIYPRFRKIVEAYNRVLGC